MNFNEIDRALEEAAEVGASASTRDLLCAALMLKDALWRWRRGR
jgi:hypothetical protein